jgi:hypothetical protein
MMRVGLFVKMVYFVKSAIRKLKNFTILIITKKFHVIIKDAIIKKYALFIMMPKRKIMQPSKLKFIEKIFKKLILIN